MLFKAIFGNLNTILIAGGFILLGGGLFFVYNEIREAERARIERDVLEEQDRRRQEIRDALPTRIDNTDATDSLQYLRDRVPSNRN